MKNTDPIMSICYDFDGTLAPGNMQEYNFFPELNVKPDDFWAETNSFAKEHEVDPILAYMKLMLDKARISGRVQISRDAFKKYGDSVKLFKGVKGWFGEINKYAGEKNVKLEHYIISSGLREMIEGTSINSYFKAVYASSFMYDQHGVAVWPANVVNYTTKTQYLYRINKGIDNITDNEAVNEFVPEEDRRVPFSRMLYIGDGSSDIPCMKLVKSQGGHSIAIFNPEKEESCKYARRLLNDGRVNFITEGDYTKNSKIFKYTAAIIDMVSASYKLYSLYKSAQAAKKQQMHP